MPSSFLTGLLEAILDVFFYEIVEWFAHTRLGRIVGCALIVLISASPIFLVGRLARWW